MWYHSGYQVMPQPGGWDDQDPDWQADMRLCLRLLAFQQQAYSSELETSLSRGR